MRVLVCLVFVGLCWTVQAADLSLSDLVRALKAIKDDANSAKPEKPADSGNSGAGNPDSDRPEGNFGDLQDVSKEFHKLPPGSLFTDGEVLMSFAKGFDMKKLKKWEENGEGEYTEWLDRDVPGPFGTGEFEEKERNRIEDAVRGQCKMWCQHPLAMQLKLAQKYMDRFTKADLLETLKCPKLKPLAFSADWGFMCQNIDQENGNYCESDVCARSGLGADCTRCPDVQVRYFCHGNRDCLDAAKRDLLEHLNMKRVLEKEDHEEQVLDALKRLIHHIEK